MKKVIIIFILIFSVSIVQAQERETIEIQDKQNELRINMTNLIILKWVDFSYERVLNEESSIGVGLLFSINSDEYIIDELRKFSITPYYRHFFSNQYAEGFFVEGFAMIHSGSEEIYFDFDSEFVEEDFTDLAIGISAGFKAVSKRGFVAEIYLGIGRDLLGSSDLELVSRGGISLGYRF
jgi:hypothetical protein